MVLRDTFSAILSSIALSALLFIGACQSSSDNSVKSTSGTAPVQERTIFSDQIQILNNDLQQTMHDMNALYLSAEAFHLGTSSAKSTPPQGNIDAVYEKSAMSMGSMFVLQGSLKAVEERFQQGILDQEHAQEMLNKLKVDLQSIKGDVVAYQQLMSETGPAPTEKK